MTFLSVVSEPFIPPRGRGLGAPSPHVPRGPRIPAGPMSQGPGPHVPRGRCLGAPVPHVPRGRGLRLQSPLGGSGPLEKHLGQCHEAPALQASGGHVDRIVAPSPVKRPHPGDPGTGWGDGRRPEETQRCSGGRFRRRWGSSPKNGLRARSSEATLRLLKPVVTVQDDSRPGGCDHPRPFGFLRPSDLEKPVAPCEMLTRDKDTSRTEERDDTFHFLKIKCPFSSQQYLACCSVSKGEAISLPIKRCEPWAPRPEPRAVTTAFLCHSRLSPVSLCTALSLICLSHNPSNLTCK